jgi:hypothetical protein
MKILLISLLLIPAFSCKRKWNEKDKSEFYSGCLTSATANKDIKDPKTYCSCLLQKVVAKYPNANHAKYIKYDTTVKQLARECMKQ